MRISNRTTKVSSNFSAVERIIRGAIIGSIIGIIAAILIGYMIDFFKKETNTTNISDDILRFHVKANSDSDEDINLKYDVRDEILNAISEDISKCDTKEQAINYLEENLDYISEVAQEVIYKEGFGYEVDANVQDSYFPIRQYGEMVIPAGIYKALNVDIGEAAGENFWCLLYPTLCYTIDSAAVVSKEGEEEIAREISVEEYEKLFINQDISGEDVEIRFKICDWLQNTLFNLL